MLRSLITGLLLLQTTTHPLCSLAKICVSALLSTSYGLHSAGAQCAVRLYFAVFLMKNSFYGCVGATQ
jgi:hypothetical protein